MTLKSTATVTAAVSTTMCITINVLVALLAHKEVPGIINMVVVGATAVGIVLAIVGELYERINGRITALTEFLVARLNELDMNTSDRNAGFVEGYLLSHGQDAAVVPFGPRLGNRRAMSGGDDRS
ncbi:hypothetical protein [Polymorphospora sp. NPDC050346]|uniref:hypothetical protein n=1 Tax=Polymorphospora sp. NPDC050346 TaxID=3155780 RepID=UPI0033E93399